MSKVKELLPDYVYDGIMSIDRYALKEEVKTMIDNGIFENKSLLREFLEEITPSTGPDYFIYVEQSKDNYVNIRYSREEYIHALCCLSQYPVTLYYHPASFVKNGWITNENANAVRCLYVDIDDVNMQADKTSKEDVIDFLKKKLNLDDSQLPRWCVLSGNGIHLVHPITELTAEDEELREKYTLSLLCYHHGDMAVLPVSHQFRCPESYNLKEEPIKGKLFMLNDSENTDIHRLDWCLKSEREIEEYRRSYYARRTEKQKATAAKNKALEKEFSEKLGDTSLEEYLSNPSISEKERNIAKKLLRIQMKKDELKKREEEIARLEGRILEYNEEDFDLYIYSENSLPYLHLREYDRYDPHNRTFNPILDLHHFFIRHKGCLVSREVFFYILANLFKLKKLPEASCIQWCKKYASNDYYSEMLHIIDLTYKSKKKYKFSYIQIANALCFDEIDIEKSFCNFSEERRNEAKRNRNKKYYRERLIEKGKTTKKKEIEFHLQYIKEHPEMTETEAKEYLGIGRTTFYNLKKHIKNTAET